MGDDEKPVQVARSELWGMGHDCEMFSRREITLIYFFVPWRLFCGFREVGMRHLSGLSRKRRFLRGWRGSWRGV